MKIRNWIWLGPLVGLFTALIIAFVYFRWKSQAVPRQTVETILFAFCIVLVAQTINLFFDKK